ncbi:MAG: response regulator, partial [Devosia sp.]
MAKANSSGRAYDYPEPSAFVVDDEPQVRAFVCNVLMNAGFKPQQLSSSAAVEAALADIIPQLIVLDLSLGDSDAIEVLRILQERHYVGDVLLISGHDEATVAEVQRIGVRRSISMLEPLRKPFRIEHL